METVCGGVTVEPGTCQRGEAGWQGAGMNCGPSLYVCIGGFENWSGREVATPCGGITVEPGTCQRGEAGW